VAGYPKIWTTLLDEPWFVPLSLNERGIYLQLLILAKKQGDTGDIIARGWSGLSHICGCDRGTVARISEKFQQMGKVRIVEKSARKIHLRVANYNKYQEVKKYLPVKNTAENSAQNDTPKSDQIRSEQSEAKRTVKQAIFDGFQKRFGKALNDSDYETLLAGNKKYPGFKNPNILQFMVENIRLPEKGTEKPVGYLLSASPRDNVGEYLNDVNYGALKMLRSQMGID
jgi:hypothetical protein